MGAWVVFHLLAIMKNAAMHMDMHIMHRFFTM